MRSPFRRRARRLWEHHEEERLSAFLDDELPEADALQVTRHLANCAACVAELEQLRRTRSALRALPAVEPPPVLFAQVATAAASVDDQRRRLRRLAAAAAAGVTLVGAAAYLAGGDDGDVVPPVDLFVVDHVTRVGGSPVVTPVDLDPAGP